MATLKNPIIYANKIAEYQQQLKPCPFCGGAAEIRICGALNDLMYVRCREISCAAAPFGATAIYEGEGNWNACFGLMTCRWNKRSN